MAAWLLLVVVAASVQFGLRRAHREGVSRADRVKVFRALSQGPAGLRSGGHGQLSDGLEHVEALLAFSAEAGGSDQPASPRRWKTELEGIKDCGKDKLRQRPGQPDPLP